MKTRSRTRSASSLSNDASTGALTNAPTRTRSKTRKSRTPTIEEGTVADDEDNNILLYDDHEPDHHNKNEKENLDSVTKEKGKEKEKEVTVRRKHQRRSRRSNRQSRSSASKLPSTVKPRVEQKTSLIAPRDDHHDASGEDNDILGVVTTSGADDSSDNDRENEKKTDDDRNGKKEDEKVEKENSSSKSTTRSSDDKDDDENSSSSSDGDDESSDDDEKDEKIEETSNKTKSAEIQRVITLASEAASKTFAWDTTMKNKRKRSIVEYSNMTKKNEKNPLSKVIPGYTAPMSLDTSPLDAYKRAGSMISTHPVATAVPSNLRAAASSISNANFKQGHKAKYRPPQTNAGPKWFGMEATPLTPQLRSDLAVLRNRNYLDPKKFYKSSDLSTSGGADRMVQLGTVVEGAAEYYSSRMSKRERKGGHSVMEQLMGEVFDGKDSYVRRKFGDISRKKQEEGMKGRRRGGAKGAKRKSGW